MKDHSRSVSLHCSTCGGDQFEDDDELEEGPVRCVGCGRTFAREEVIRENGEHVEANVEEIKDEVMRDFGAGLQKAFKGFP